MPKGLLPMHQSPPTFGVFSKQVTGRPRSFSAFTTGRPLEPAPMTQVRGRPWVGCIFIREVWHNPLNC